MHQVGWLTIAMLLLFVQHGCAELELKMKPPRLVGASNDSATHYWFPTDMAVVFNASHFLLGARLADDCSDYFCYGKSEARPLGLLVCKNARLLDLARLISTLQQDFRFIRERYGHHGKAKLLFFD